MEKTRHLETDCRAILLLLQFDRQTSCSPVLSLIYSTWLLFAQISVYEKTNSHLRCTAAQCSHACKTDLPPPVCI